MNFLGFASQHFHLEGLISSLEFSLSFSFCIFPAEGQAPLEAAFSFSGGGGPLGAGTRSQLRGPVIIDCGVTVEIGRASCRERV